jgi:O-antigen biosynthesis protein
MSETPSHQIHESGTLFRGMVDSLIDGEVSGWVYNEKQPTQQYDVQAVAPDGSVLAVTKACLPRPDLLQFNRFIGGHGFRFQIEGFDRGSLLKFRYLLCGHPFNIEPAKDLVHLVTLESLWHNASSWFRKIVACPRVIGHFDSVTMGVARGWAYSQDFPDHPLSIKLFSDSKLVAEGVADRPRDDLLLNGFRLGRRAFQIKLPVECLRDSRSLEAYGPGLAPALSKAEDFIFDRRLSFGCVDSSSLLYITGWAVDLTSVDPAQVEILWEDRVIANSRADLPRDDLHELNISENTGFRAKISSTLAIPSGTLLKVRIQSTGAELDGSPVKFNCSPHLVKWLTRKSRFPPDFYVRLRARLSKQKDQQTITIVMPVFNTRPMWLREAIESVIGQWSGCWELICIDDGSTASEVRRILEEYAQIDKRIKTIFQKSNKGIAFATNVGLTEAKGQYVLFMDHDDVLEPDAITKMSIAIKKHPDLIYSDEVLTSEYIDDILRPVCRPAFSYDYYRSHPYFVHAIAVRTELARAIGGLDISMRISADVDFILRILERSEHVIHIPFILYRWRSHAMSAGHVQINNVTDATVKSLQHHLNRTNPGAAASQGSSFNHYKISYPDPGGKVAIIIPTRDRLDLLRPCIESVFATCNQEDFEIYIVDNNSVEEATFAYFSSLEEKIHVIPFRENFNYSKINNFVCEQIPHELLCFMNNDIEAIESGWLQRLRSILARREVGVVSPKLVYSDFRVQHGGVIVGLNAAAEHSHKFIPAVVGELENPGYNGGLSALRDYSAVTAACMLTKHSIFREVGGFDEAFKIGFGDIDLCLRIGEAGFKILYDGSTTLIHHESASRRNSIGVDHPQDNQLFTDRWRETLSQGDPFYSPLLSLRGKDHELAEFIKIKHFRLRSTRLV